MEKKHSPEPWSIHGDSTAQDFYIHGANRICDLTKPQGFYRSPVETEANAARIVACVNACEGIVDPAQTLDEYAHKLQWRTGRVKDLEALNAELVAALNGLFEHCAMPHKHWGEGSNAKQADAAIAYARATLAKVTA